MKRDFVKPINPIQKRANAKIVDMNGRYFLIGIFIFESRRYDNNKSNMRYLLIQNYQSLIIKIRSLMAST